MNEKSLRVLEYDKILQQLEAFATSESGKKRCRDLKPFRNISEIIEALRHTSEAQSMLLHVGNAPFGPITDMKEITKLAVIGGCLSPRQLLAVSDVLRTARTMKRFLTLDGSYAEKYPTLYHYGQILLAHQATEKVINDAIISENEIADHASPALYKIRRTMEQKQSAIRQKLDAMIGSQQTQKYLQDALVTMRNDRYVIPVKSEHKNSVKGIVHDQSAKGSTFYIEPIAVVELNNQLNALKIDEQKEIERILRELTGKVAEIADPINVNFETLTTLDFIFAKGKLSENMRGIAPEVSDSGQFKLKKARHPLIAPKDVVPNTIWLGDAFTTLLITGPNTGGKTVMLKTVGLMTLMAQAGLHIPVDYGSKITIFDEVFADIGDEQSIEQSLSTFSSHMTNIVKILQEVTPKSLVLFDELGAGTDPTEGAALAMAILDQLKKWKIRTVATTHYAELKAYAISNEGIENASVEFDVPTLSPTYRLLIGIPGKSNAFEISRKLGLSPVLIDHAKAYVHQDNIEFETIISQIEHSRKVAEEEQDEAIRLKLEIEHIKKRLAEKEEKLTSQRDKIVNQAKQEARQLLKAAKEEADITVKKLRDIQNSAEKSSNKDVEAMRRELNKKLDEMTEQTINKDVETEFAPDTVLIGDTVRVLSINQEGVVKSLPDAKGELTVQVGLMKMNVNIKGLLTLSKKAKDAQTYQRTKSSSAASKHITTEIDVRGQNIEEAILEIDLYIDQAVMANLNKVRIIHGKGTGALRKGLHDHFKKHKQIKHFEFAAYNEGGNGATEIELK
jgi:DNA mismatch repair protein MutS2